MSNTGKRLANKIAIVTGSASGIGYETCLVFLLNGVEGLICVDILDSDKGNNSLQNLIAESGFPAADVSSKVKYFRADVSKAEDMQRLISFTEETFGKLHVLFNNAGIMHPHDDTPETTSEAVWDLTMNVNLKGVWLGVKYAMPLLLKSAEAGFGCSIINTASFVALMGAATAQIAYTASKGGVLAITREMATIYARKNVRVNAICPGPLKTPLLMNYLNTDEKQQRRLVHVPMGRFGEAYEIAKVALFLASDESSFITGAEIKVDGGITSAYVTPEGETKSLPPAK